VKMKRIPWATIGIVAFGAGVVYMLAYAARPAVQPVSNSGLQPLGTPSNNPAVTALTTSLASLFTGTTTPPTPPVSTPSTSTDSFPLF
jgi:hypothetical protein